MSSRERPILFSGPMVRALLDGRKTVTRRIIKTDWWRCLDPDDEEDRAEAVSQNPYGQPGDRLWVRETWGRTLEFNDDGDPTGATKLTDSSGATAWVVYRAGNEEWVWTDGDGYTGPSCWRPSIHMPRWASRLTLEVVSVCVERLHLITGWDAQREGVETYLHGAYDFDYAAVAPALANFRRLWESINGPGSWDRNDWVWRVEFRRLP